MKGYAAKRKKLRGIFVRLLKGLLMFTHRYITITIFFARCSLKILGTKLAEQFIIIINNSIFINKLIILSIFLMTSLKLLKYNIPAKKTRMNLTPLKLTVPL